MRTFDLVGVSQFMDCSVRKIRSDFDHFHTSSYNELNKFIFMTIATKKLFGSVT